MRALSFDESRFVGVVPCQIGSGETDHIMDDEWFCGDLLCRRRLGFADSIRAVLGRDVPKLEYGIVYSGAHRAQAFVCGTLAEYICAGMTVRGTYQDGGLNPRYRITRISSRSQVGHIREWSADDVAAWVDELLVVQPELVSVISI